MKKNKQKYNLRKKEEIGLFMIEKIYIFLISPHNDTLNTKECSLSFWNKKAYIFAQFR